MLQNIISRIEPWPNLHDLPPILLNIRHPPVSLVGGWLPWSTWQPCHGHQAELVILAQLHRVLGERWANTYTIHPIQLGPSLTFFLECLKKNSNGLVQICIGKNLCFPIFPSIVPLLKWHSLHPWSWAWNRNSLEVRFRSWVICRFPAVNLPGCNRFFFGFGKWGRGPGIFSPGGKKIYRWNIEILFHLARQQNDIWRTHFGNFLVPPQNARAIQV